MTKAFQDYYSKLYNLAFQEIKIEKLQMAGKALKYIQELGMSTLTEQEGIDLDQLITVEGFNKMVKEAVAGKTPGSDGFSIGYYTFFNKNLARQFVETYNSIREGSNITKIL